MALSFRKYFTKARDTFTLQVILNRCCYNHASVILCEFICCWDLFTYELRVFAFVSYFISNWKIMLEKVRHDYSSLSVNFMFEKNLKKITIYICQIAYPLFKTFLEDVSPFCGATDTPVLDFWWHLLWISKPEWVLPYSSLVEVYMLHVPWDSPLVWQLPTSWHPAWQLSQLFHIPARHWWDSKPGAIMPPLTEWDREKLDSILNVYNIYCWVQCGICTFLMTNIYRSHIV